MDRKSNRFVLEGRVIHWLHQIQAKRILIATSQGEVVVKLSKDLRRYFLLQPQPAVGAWIRLSGEIKKNGKYRADSLLGFIDRPPAKIQPIPSPAIATTRTATMPTPVSTPANPPRSQSSPKPPACILVCGKSSCQRRGAGAVIASLKETLRDRGLAAQVEVKTTGCLKKCKQGANILCLPDKTAYTQVKPIQASSLVNKHFPSSFPAETVTPCFPEQVL